MADETATPTRTPQHECAYNDKMPDVWACHNAMVDALAGVTLGEGASVRALVEALANLQQYTNTMGMDSWRTERTLAAAEQALAALAPFAPPAAAQEVTA